MAAVTGADPFLRRELSGAPLVTARLAATALGVLALVLFARGVPRVLALAHDRAVSAAQEDGWRWLETASAVVTWIAIAAALVWCGLAALILWRRSRDLFGIALAVGFIAIGVIVPLRDQALVGGGSTSASQTDPLFELGRVVIWILTASALVWVFSFPDGRFVPSWSVALAAVWAVWALLRIPFPEQLSHARYGAASAALYAAFPLAGLAAQIYRFARRSDAVQRQQLKWFVYGGAFIVVAWICAVLLAVLGPSSGSSASAFFFQAASAGLLAASSMILPVTIGIAIFRQGLFNIDLLINRTVMYSVLTIALVAAFIALGTVAQRAYAEITGGTSDVATVAVAVIVAVAFVPLRSRVQDVADRFLSDRAVLTIVFLDLSGSTAKLAEIGDRAWHELLERYRSAVRRELRRHGGREIDTAGDGFFVTFGSPASAIRFARAAVASIRPLGVDARAGLHICEVVVHGGRVTGIGVHIGARIVATAEAGEVLVSRTLRDLVAGSEIRLRDRGLHPLKGVPGRWHLYAVVGS